VGLGNPCSPHDHELLGAATCVTIGNGKQALFWEAAWLEGLRPKDVAPLIFKLSKRKKITICKALEDDFWVSKINIQEGLNVCHLHQFCKLWEMLANVQLNNEAPDSITWKVNNNGCYSTKLAYNMQFLGLITFTMPTLVWKPWAPPKCKTFTWLILQNLVWAADRLEKRGSQNCGLCKLFNQI
jgi:hypothetical protein